MRIVLALLFVLVAEPVHAKTAILDSLEWRAHDADVVVRGVVLRVDKQDDPARRRAEYVSVTVQVTEVLRGGAAKSLRFAMHESEAPALMWAKHRTDLLLFLVDSKRREEKLRFAPLALREHHRHSFELGKDNVPTSDFADLSRVDDILTAARAACSGKRITESMAANVPFDTPLFERTNGGSAVYLTIPKEDRQDRALRHLRSSQVVLRVAGARLLGETRTPVAVSTLEKLLADPTLVDRRYPLRAVAHEALTRWSVPHAAPVLTSP
jgi:hypothetical protein